MFSVRVKAVDIRSCLMTDSDDEVTTTISQSDIEEPATRTC